MSAVLLHFAIGTVGALAIFLLFWKFLRRESFSAPFAVVFVGIACALAAHVVSPWCTPGVLLMYALTEWHEWRQEPRDRGDSGG